MEQGYHLEGGQRPSKHSQQLGAWPVWFYAYTGWSGVGDRGLAVNGIGQDAMHGSKVKREVWCWRGGGFSRRLRALSMEEALPAELGWQKQTLWRLSCRFSHKIKWLPDEASQTHLIFTIRPLGLTKQNPVSEWMKTYLMDVLHFPRGQWYLDHG